MASDKQNPSSLPESLLQRAQFVAYRYKEADQYSVSMGVKRRTALASIENILPQSDALTPEIVKTTGPSPLVRKQSIGEGNRWNRMERPAESMANAGTEESKKRLRKL